MSQFQINCHPMGHHVDSNTWQFLFVCSTANVDIRFPIFVADSVAVANREGEAKKLFKDAVAILASEVAAF